MSNVASVITTTNNTVVDSANSAVSIGRWSNLSIIASSFRCAFSFPYLAPSLDWLRSNDTSFLPLVLISVHCEPFARYYLPWISFDVLEPDMLTLVAPPSREVVGSFPTCSGNSSRLVPPSVGNRVGRTRLRPALRGPVSIHVLSLRALLGQDESYTALASFKRGIAPTRIYLSTGRGDAI